VSARTDTTPTATAREIESQPAVWRQALALPHEQTAGLPAPGESVLGIGAGTSFYILDAYARRRQELCGDVTRAAIASELDELVTYDRVLYLSRSGTTADVLRADRALAGRSPTLAISGTPGSPLVAKADGAILLPFADESSIVQTRFATTALLLLRQSLGEDMSGLPAQAEAALADALPVDPDRHRHIVFLGSGWTLGIAHEAALKCSEAAALVTEAYAVGEYRHGPIAVAGEGSLVWSFSPLPDDIRRAVAATGADIVESRRDALAELVLAHRVALAVALARGLDPDAPQHLSRSVDGS
jgi:glucosamine--fructose-6-phosphate aminotransferase (isomerizing)